MDTFLSRNRRESAFHHANVQISKSSNETHTEEHEDEDSTDVKLATLASLFPEVDHAAILDLLISTDGSVEAVRKSFSNLERNLSPRKRSAIGHQTSLHKFRKLEIFTTEAQPAKRRALTKKGQTLHLYSPEDVAANTPCSIIHNFLPTKEADDLLIELLQEAPTFERQTFKLFDNVVQSPHSACFYVNDLDTAEEQKTEYLYNGSFLTDVRQITPQMRNVSAKVQSCVNVEIEKRIQQHYPNGKKLKYQYPHPWIPNAAFVNCYAGGAESVGYHSDQLTYLGPRAIIGSLSLGVAREFRIRKIVARDDEDTNISKDQRADAEGQIAM